MNAKDARIEMYFHCMECMEKLTDAEKKQVAAGKRGWSSKEELEIGWTPQGIQAVCRTCGKNIIDLDFMGQKVDYYNPKKPNTKKYTPVALTRAGKTYFAQVLMTVSEAQKLQKQLSSGKKLECELSDAYKNGHNDLECYMEKGGDN